MSAIPRVLTALPIAVALATAAAARADTLDGSTSHVVETAHEIEVTMDHGRATLAVRRTFASDGAAPDRAVLSIELPGGAVATGLRSLVTRGAPRWLGATLVDSDAARTIYDGENAGVAARDRALLSWSFQDTLALEVFPVAAGRPKTVEYTVVLPTTYVDGRDHLELPRLGLEKRPAKVRVRAARRGERLFVGGAQAADGAPVAPGDASAVTVELERSAQPAIDGALASVSFGRERHLARWRIEAARRLSEAPQGARVVVVLDGSRSVTAADAKASRAAAAAYLSHLRDAKVEVLTFDREVHERHGGLVDAAAAIADLARLPDARRNGSRLDDALRRADAILAATPPGAPRRIVAMTDLRTREALDVDDVSVAPASGALVHVGVVRAGAPSMTRDDDDAWAKPLRATGGLLWRASANERADDADMRRVYEEWARPVRIDHVSVVVPGLDPATLEAPASLDEGAAIEELRIERDAVRSVAISGELWATSTRRVFSPSEAEGTFWAAAVLGTAVEPDLSDPEKIVLARRGHAVSSVTSLLAFEPGAAPPEIGTGSLGAGGIGEGSSGSSHCTLGVTEARLRGDLDAELRRALAPAWAACGGGVATIAIETTRDEVVDVPSARVERDPSGALARCLIGAAWELVLPPTFDDEHRTFTISL